MTASPCTCALVSSLLLVKSGITPEPGRAWASCPSPAASQRLFCGL